MSHTSAEDLIETVQRPITKEDPFKICFVCLGNICRSPTAEGVFQHVVDEAGYSAYFEIDSSGTSAYHVGEPANSKSQMIANQNGVKLHSRARRFEYSDLEYFDLLLAMDESNLKNIQKADTKNKYLHKVALMRTFDPENGDISVPDPYAGGIRGFHNVFDIIERSSKALLQELEPYIKS